MTTGASPAFVRNGTAIVFERWTNRWTDKASSNLWILELKPGATPRRIITDASEPAGAMLRKKLKTTWAVNLTGSFFSSDWFSRLFDHRSGIFPYAQRCDTIPIRPIETTAPS